MGRKVEEGPPQPAHPQPLSKGRGEGLALFSLKRYSKKCWNMAVKLWRNVPSKDGVFQEKGRIRIGEE